jgi:antibiotic biosynthesis monooxygenase (ABM) superfamily enzyme
VATAALLPIAMAAVYKPGYYHDYAEVCALMEMWAEKYPGYTDLESVRTMTSPLGGP